MCARTSVAISVSVLFLASVSVAQNRASDPGVRTGQPGAGGPLVGLTPYERAYFDAGLEAFEDTNSVQGTLPETEAGLGPTFNLDSCGGCHIQPAIGGTSPATNPQVAMATKAGARNTVPSFIRLEGPIREARFKFNRDGSRDGGVHALFTIAGRSDAPGCNVEQPNFAAAVSSRNISFRIPTPVFGTGLIEAISESTILANKEANSFAKRSLGISGRENRNDNDGTITRFGWKAQNKSLAIFSAEAYNVEQGVTNEGFPNERDETPGCRFNTLPEDATGFDALVPGEVPSDMVAFAVFMKFLAPPTPAAETRSITNGRTLFSSIGCAHCHTPTLQTGRMASAALSDKAVNLYSDLLLHDMGEELEDDIEQGRASGREFRTAPLWGLGQRIFFLHDGRTKNLIEAIRAHSSQGSEANRVISNYSDLSDSQKQDLLNFLRSL